MIRAATPQDLEAIGRPGALLVHEHHDLDERRLSAKEKVVLLAAEQVNRRSDSSRVRDSGAR